MKLNVWSQRKLDILYVLRQQWARHGVPEELCKLCTDMSAEFREHADRWGFRHITSSSTYRQANGCAEAAIRRAKTLMAKDAEAGVDPFLALLDQRNTPSEYLQLSPAGAVDVQPKDPHFITDRRRCVGDADSGRRSDSADEVEATSSGLLKSRRQRTTDTASRPNRPFSSQGRRLAQGGSRSNLTIPVVSFTSGRWMHPPP